MPTPTPLLRWLVLACLSPLVACGDAAQTPADGPPDDGAATQPGQDTPAADTPRQPGDAPAQDTPADHDAPDPLAELPWLASGALEVLTYNVAGLPGGLSSSDPLRYTPLISPLLAAYDLALVQEDFGFHEALAADAPHPYQSTPMEELPRGKVMNDGLNRFGYAPFDVQVERHAWEACNGFVDAASDCLAAKGFTYAVHVLSPGVEVGVYNLHMDAGGGEADAAARGAQVDQLTAHMAAHAEGRALIVAGDTNLQARREQDMVHLERLLSSAGLIDVCRALSCGDERIDRVLYRSSDALTLEPTGWSIPEVFVDPADGQDLSDHLPVLSVFAWTRR